MLISSSSLGCVVACILRRGRPGGRTSHEWGIHSPS